MSHEIFAYDGMMSVYETPWHGLGVVLDDYVSAQEAQKAAGLTWKVRKEPIYFKNEGLNSFEAVEDQFVTVRDDIEYALGVVGRLYTPYQNDDMFKLIDEFCKLAGSKIETCGSLRNGRVVWALAKAGEVEYLVNDPVNKFFLIKNGFDGSNNIQVCFTDIRVVCNNTLTAALREASNAWSIRHTQAMHDSLSTVMNAIQAQQIHAKAMKEAMQTLISFQMSETQMQAAAIEIFKGESNHVEDFKDAGADIFELVSTRNKNMVSKVLRLHDEGRGSDIPGVRGNGYGFVNAITEFADHYRTVKTTSKRNKAEARFESVMMGNAQELKTRGFLHTLKLAKAA